MVRSPSTPRGTACCSLRCLVSRGCTSDSAPQRHPQNGSKRRICGAFLQLLGTLTLSSQPNVSPRAKGGALREIIHGPLVAIFILGQRVPEECLRGDWVSLRFGGLGFRVWGLGFRGLGFRFWGHGKDLGLGFRCKTLKDGQPLGLQRMGHRCWTRLKLLEKHWA